MNLEAQIIDFYYELYLNYVINNIYVEDDEFFIKNIKCFLLKFLAENRNVHLCLKKI